MDRLGSSPSAPMSERQQLALIKKLEKQEQLKLQEQAAANNDSPDNGRGSLATSPPRTPLQVVNVGTPGSNFHESTGGGSIHSSASSAVSSPLTGRRASLQDKNLPKSPAIDRLMKKISKKNGKGETALHTAAIKGSRRMVKTLLQLGADPNAQDNAEWSPLHEACNRGNYSVVKLLLEFGADIDLKGFAKDSPLHDAARNGHLRVVKHLVVSGADLSARNASGRTPREEAEIVAARIRATAASADEKGDEGGGDEDDEVTWCNVVNYLTNQEEQAKEEGSASRVTGSRKSSVATAESSLCSSGEEESSSDSDSENSVARFLGVSSLNGSPDCPNSLRQAFQSLGLPSFLQQQQQVQPKDQHQPPPLPPKGCSGWITSKSGGHLVTGYNPPLRLSGGPSLLLNNQIDRSGLTKVRLSYPGTTSNAGEVNKMDNTPASSSTGGNNKQSNNAGDSAMSKGSDSSKPSTTSKTAAENDPYEFMSGSSKEPTPDKVTDTGKSDTTKKDPVGSGEKRPAPDSKDGDESERKKAKTDAPATSVATSGTGGTIVKLTGRSTRGSSSEKTTAPSSGPGSSSASSAKKGPISGLTAMDRKSPVGTSAANSPRKPQSSRDQSDEDTGAGGDSQVGQSAGGDGKSGPNDDQSKPSLGLKVPPLKIVLNSLTSGKDGSGGSGNNGSGNGAGNSGKNGGPKQTAASTGSSSNYEDSRGASDSQGTASDSDSAPNATGTSGPPGTSGGAETDKSGGETPASQNDPSGAGLGGADSVDGAKGVLSATAASRVTRSRANQGTPGPQDESQSDGATSADSSNNQPAYGSTGGGGGGGGVQSTSTGNRGASSRLPQDTDSLDYNKWKTRKLRSQVDDSGNVSYTTGGASSPARGSGAGPSGAGVSGSQGGSGSQGAPGASGAAGSERKTTEPMNDIEKFLNIRKAVEQRRKNLFPVQPKPPEGFEDYLMNRKTYLLQQNAPERLRSLPMIQPPHSLEGPLKQLFKEQEQERYKLRMKHVVEKEKLVLAVEQEILRVHGRAARALANQSLPFSVCTILRDEEIYTPIDPELEEKNRDIRSRYNGRLFLSWLQDVDDKWEKIKEQMVLRHHNEAESLNAVQKMDWEWKVSELNLARAQASGSGSGQNSSHQHHQSVNDLHIPMVHVSDDFDVGQ